MSAPDILSGGLDDIPSFGDPEHEAAIDREHEARISDAWANYEEARANVTTDKARRVPIETDQPAPQAQSSVQIEDAAKGDPRVTTKLYVGSPLTDALLDAALEAHAYVHRMAAEMALSNWQKTVDSITEAGMPR